MKYSIVSFCFLGFSASLVGHEWSTARADGHAPIGVMGDHVHKKGEWMASYRYMHMRMEGNRSGTDGRSVGQVHAGWPVSPVEMTMEMHMLGLMYAPTDRFTLMAMVPFVSLSMDHATRMGVRFTTETEGVGDVRLTGLYQVGQWESHSVHLNLGMSFPTGSTDERDDTPAGRNALLPYPMQTGAGSFDALPGVTYLGQSEYWSWGSQARSVIRLNDNGDDYRLGDRVGATAWLARKLSAAASLSGRLDWEAWGNIDGADPRLNPAMVPTADPDLRGGHRLDLLFGLNLYAPNGFLKGHRVALEGGFPLYQNLDGPQLETDWIMTVGWQCAW